MDKNVKIASFMLYIVCAIFIMTASGIFYFVTLPQSLSDGMAATNGITADALKTADSSIVDSMVVVFSANGALLLAISIGLIQLLRGPFKDRQPWASNVIFSILMTQLILLELITLQNFPTSPWPIWAFCLLLTVTAWLVSRPAFAKTS